ncbi:hypothetical protein D3C86_1627200 [compost metagenome]
MSIESAVDNKLTRKQKIIIILAVSAMWSISTAYNIYLKVDLERFRIESRNESDRMSALVFEEFLKKLIEKRQAELEDQNKDWSI